MKTTEGITVHKKSLKLQKKYKYKDGKTGKAVTKLPYWIVPAHLRLETFVEAQAELCKFAEEAKKEQAGKQKQFDLNDVTKAHT